jgi:GDP-4-dehydro-6-deoxy-D-mannose reductase
MPIETTLVTGAAGFAGSHLLDRLGDRSPVVAWRRPGGSPPSSESHVEWQAVDIVDADAVRRALDDVRPRRIYHLAGAAAVDTSWKSVVPHLQVNALGTHHLLEAVRTGGFTCRVLVVTSSQIYQVGDEPVDEGAPLVPPNPYGLSKLAQDQIALRAVQDDALDVVIARPFNHIGPRQTPGFAVASFARQIARIEAGEAAPEIRVGNLDARRDVTDVRDVVDAYVQLMHAAPPGRPYNVCSGRAWRMGDLLEELVHLSTTDVRVETDPARMRPNDVPVFQGNATRIRTEIGWVSTIKVEQTLRDTLDWWRREVRAGR